ncbi:hypothetical protein EDB86DRAFT_2838168 [Lactarius hatsudake]|nr:hypothetical protein EDB86DRAFT_2838168 [Lactarius hatsudake]
MRRCVGLASEWWWWLAVRLHVWEWWWWASMEVGGGHGGQRHTRLGKKKGLVEAESGVWETVLCGVGKHPSTYVLQHFKLQASKLNVQHFNISTTEQLNCHLPGIALHMGHPLYSRENTVAGTQSATPPRSIPWPSPPRRDVGLWPTILSIALHAGHPSTPGKTPSRACNPPHHHALSLAPPLLRCWALAHYIKINLTPPRCLCLHLAAHNPVAAASNPSPCTCPPPPPPPLTACKNRRNATPTRMEAGLMVVTWWQREWRQWRVGSSGSGGGNGSGGVSGAVVVRQGWWWQGE